MKRFKLNSFVIGGALMGLSALSQGACLDADSVTPTLTAARGFGNPAPLAAADTSVGAFDASLGLDVLADGGSPLGQDASNPRPDVVDTTGPNQPADTIDASSGPDTVAPPADPFPPAPLTHDSSGLHIEARWYSPAATDESDPEGADLDLHLLHPQAAGRWFHRRYDCHSFNASPDWDGRGRDDDPSLVNDVVDGSGAEILALGAPSEGNVYTLGIQNWDDADLGPATAQVLIYWDGALIANRVAALIDGDLWNVGYIQDGVFTPLRAGDGSPVIETGIGDDFQP